MSLALLKGCFVNLSPVGRQCADLGHADDGNLMTRARHCIPIGRLVDGARLEGREDEATEALVPRLWVDALVNATDLLCWESG